MCLLRYVWEKANPVWQLGQLRLISHQHNDELSTPSHQCEKQRMTCKLVLMIGLSIHIIDDEISTLVVNLGEKLAHLLNSVDDKDWWAIN